MNQHFPADGRLEDYPVFRILAEIGTNRLSGVLTVFSEADTIDLFFDSGACVFAESHYPREELHLGQLLVNRGYCDQDQLKNLLNEQKTKMLKLGRMARDAGWLTDTELMRVLEDQVLLILFPSLTWTHGIYFFKSSDCMPYDKTLFRPVDLKPVFRSGQKILKTWSWMQERMPNETLVPSRTEAKEVIPEGVKLEHSDASSNTFVMTRIQEKVYELIDGNRTIREVLDGVHLFEWFARIALLDLEDAAVITIQEMKAKTKKKASAQREKQPINLIIFLRTHAQVLMKVLAGTLGLLVVGYLISHVSFKNMMMPKKIYNRAFTPKSSTITLMEGNAIRSAIVVFYLNRDSFPETLDDMVRAGLLATGTMMDGWDNRFEYRKIDDRYELRSPGPDGELSTSDDVVLTGQISDHIFGCYYPQSPALPPESIQQ
ncbi:DUF4388 domain-containing protein [bacterium]|nr:DUF4388 domain-containing protein [candidate division CSSED10-310 bacterium]